MVLTAKSVVNVLMVLGPDFEPNDFSLPHGQKCGPDILIRPLISHFESLLCFPLLIEVNELPVIEPGLMCIVNVVSLLDSSLKYCSWLFNLIFDEPSVLVLAQIHLINAFFLNE